MSIQQSFVRNNHYLLESTNLALKASTRQQPDRLERLRKFVEQRDDDDDTNKSTSCSSIESLLTSNPNKKPRWDQDKHLAVKKVLIVLRGIFRRDTQTTDSDDQHSSALLALGNDRHQKALSTFAFVQTQQQQHHHHEPRSFQFVQSS